MQNSNLSKYIFLALLPAVLWLISNIHVNKHYHVLSCGTIIEHSHPYNNNAQNPIQDHEHSDLEYSFLAHICSNSNFENTDAPGIDLLLINNIEIPPSIYKQLHTTTSHNKLQKLRAPPLS